MRIAPSQPRIATAAARPAQPPTLPKDVGYAFGSFTPDLQPGWGDGGLGISGAIRLGSDSIPVEVFTPDFGDPRKTANFTVRSWATDQDQPRPMSKKELLGLLGALQQFVTSNAKAEPGSDLDQTVQASERMIRAHQRGEQQVA